MNKYILRTILIGDTFVGKSNILEQLCYNNFNENTKSTLGIDFFTKNFIIDDINIKFHIWDTSGKPHYKYINMSYYKNIDIILLCYDVSNIDSFNNIINWYNDIKDLDIDKSLIYIIGNKIDIPYSEVSINKLETLANELNTSYKEISAKDNNIITDLFLEICNNFLKSNSRKKKDNSINLIEQSKHKSKETKCTICT